MTSQSPRIYIYKITFEEVLYYYYGSKKEKYYNQEYWGSPVTHKWMWKFYTPKKQILQLFDTREEANAIENRIMQVTNFLKKHFGRFTIRDISNSHIDTKGNLVMKSSIIISSYPSDEEFNSNKLKLINFLLVCAEDWGVKEIIFMYEEDTYYTNTP